jgi:hypothetical protein
VIGLPKLLRIIAPNANIQVYIGLLVMVSAQPGCGFEFAM